MAALAGGGAGLGCLGTWTVGSIAQTAACLGAVLSVQRPTWELVLPHCTIDLVGGALRSEEGLGDRLTEMERRLLSFLVEHAGVTQSKQVIYEQVWQVKAWRRSKTLNVTMSNLRRKIEPEPSRPRYLRTEIGRGYRFDGPEPEEAHWSREDGPSLHGQAVRVAPDEHRLIGRDGLLSQLDEVFARAGGLVSLVGIAGVGKTALARHWAITRHASWGGGVWFCELSDCPTADTFIARVAQVLGVRVTEADGSGVGQLGHALEARGRVVLVLDNLEQVVGPAAAAISRWLGRAPELRILATSQRALELREEVRIVVPPLDPGAAIEMFMERALFAGALNLSAADPALAELVERLDRLPLALELAAARAEILQPAEIVARLEDRFGLLTARVRDLDPRRSTLRAALEWAWSELREVERRTLAWCSVFEGGFTVAAAEGVLPGSHEGVGLLDVLEDLHGNGWFRIERRGAGEPRLNLFESVREFALEQLRTLSEETTARDCHAVWYAHALDSWREWQAGARFRDALRQHELERQNLLAALEHSESNAPERAAHMALRLHEAAWYVERGPWTYALLDRGVRSARQGREPAVLADLLLRRAMALSRARRPGPHAAEVEEAVRLAEADGDPAVACRARFGRFMVGKEGWGHGDWEEGLRALAMAEAQGDVQMQANLQGWLGHRLVQQGRLGEAAPRLELSLALAERGASPADRLVSRERWADLLQWRGRSEDAVAELRACVAASMALGLRPRAAVQGNNLSHSLLRLGRLDEAESALVQALKLAGLQGMAVIRAVALGNLSSVLVERGDLVGADRAAREAWAALRTHRHDLAIAELAWVRGIISLELGRFDEALGNFSSAAEGFVPHAHHPGARALRVDGALALHALGRDREALGWLERVGLDAAGRTDGLSVVALAHQAALWGRMDPSVASEMIDEARGQLGGLGGGTLGVVELWAAHVGLPAQPPPPGQAVAAGGLGEVGAALVRRVRVVCAALEPA